MAWRWTRPGRSMRPRRRGFGRAASGDDAVWIGHRLRYDAAMTALSPFNGLNLDRLLEARANERPDHPFLVWVPFEGETKTWTYRQFAGDAARLAGGLAARGIGPGDR